MDFYEYPVMYLYEVQEINVMFPRSFFMSEGCKNGDITAVLWAVCGEKLKLHDEFQTHYIGVL